MQGQVGVYRTAAELLRRGLLPYLPVVDVGVDIIVNGSVRVQVKSTAQAILNRWDARHFNFTLQRAGYHRGRRVEASRRAFSTEVDFLVLHAIAENRYWIVPAVVGDGRAAFMISAESRQQWIANFDLATAQRLRAAGTSYRVIGEQLGVSWSTVRARLLQPERRRAYTDLFQYEDRWDLITGALSTLEEAVSVVSPLSQESTRSTVLL